MRYLLFLVVFLTLGSCSPPTKEEASDYYGKIRFVLCDDILVQLDEQRAWIGEYTSDPGKLTEGPSAEEHSLLLSYQKENITDLRACLADLEKVESLGDDANYLGNLKMYLNARLKFEKEVMLKMVERLKDGMTPEESDFLGKSTRELMELQKLQKTFFDAEEKFLKEFNISEDDLNAIYENLIA